MKGITGDSITDSSLLILPKVLHQLKCDVNQTKSIFTELFKEITAEMSLSMNESLKLALANQDVIALSSREEFWKNKVSQYLGIDIANAVKDGRYLETFIFLMYIIKFINIETIKDPSRLLKEAKASLLVDIPTMYKSNDFLEEVKASKNEREKKIFEKAMTCSDIKTMYDKATLTPSSGKTGEYKLQLVEDDEISFGGEVDFENRVIKVRASLSDDVALSIFVFELTNALSCPRFEKVEIAAQERSISCEEYAKRREKIEHDGTLLHHQVMQKAMNEMGWGANVDRYCNQTSFDEYWEREKDGPHVNFFREQGRELCGLV